MKGLTPEEYATLRDIAEPMMIDNEDWAAVGICRDLAEQGRAVVTFGPVGEGFYLTPAGREALRLWPLLRERFSREGSK